ncbi:MAG: hypothetical protein H6672_20690 [Anaerolineaceae bacterium]|nr:hypothetical protein [Anaerolineaceae bacterium]
MTCADSAPYEYGVTAVAWNPDRLEIASAGGDGVVNMENRASPCGLPL